MKVRTPKPLKLRGINLFKEIKSHYDIDPGFNEQELTLWNNLDDGTAVLWDPGKSGWTIFRLRMFKKLISFIITNKPIAKTAYAREHVKAYEDFREFMTLTISPIKRSAAYFGKSLLDRAIQYHFTDIVVMVSRYLMRYYSTEEFNKAKSQKYLGICEQYSAYQKQEINAEKYYCQYDSTFSLKKRLVSKQELRAHKIQQYLDEVPTVRFQLAARLFLYLVGRDREKNVAAFAYESLKAFEALPFNYRPGRLIFSFFYVEELMKAARYEDCLGFVEKSLIAFGTKKDHNYNRLLETKLRVHLKLGQVDVSAQLIDLLNTRRMRLRSTILDRMKIYKLYQGILVGDLKNIRLRKIINDLSKFERDKTGTNLSLLVAELLLLLFREDYNSLIDCDRNVRGYIYKHKLGFTKEAIFIKLILATPSYNSNVKSGASRIEKYLQLLQQHEASSEMEIVDYLHVWQLYEERIMRRGVRVS